MATTHPQPALANVRPPELAASGAGEVPDSQGLVTVPLREQDPDDEPAGFNPPISLLPVELDVAVPVRQFRVRNLLALQPGQLIESQWGNGEDVPLASGDVQLAWTEFEVIETQLAVRITRLA